MNEFISNAGLVLITIVILLSGIYLAVKFDPVKKAFEWFFVLWIALSPACLIIFCATPFLEESNYLAFIISSLVGLAFSYPLIRICYPRIKEMINGH